MSTPETLPINSTDLFLNSCKTLSLQSPQTPPPVSFSLLSSSSPLPPIPTHFPQSKLIPKTRFIIDGFKISGDYSISYFLTHFHSDHYGGLTPLWCKGLIFCSDVTARLLIQVLKVSSSFVVSLPVNERTLIDGCEVALIDANHCPGAVQFLFKVYGVGGTFERYVHTGDFRYCCPMKAEPLLSEFVGADAVFLDTTYCNPKFVFPSQEDSVNYIVNVIDRIGNENKGSSKSVLFLLATYIIGKEKILLEVARRCNRKILVDNKKMDILCILGYGKDGIFTVDESETDVHVVGWNILGETWPFFRPNFVKMKEIMVEKGYSKVVGFVPTGWTYEVKRNTFTVRTKDSFEIHLVPYSEHSNYDELREYVKFLKPKHVIPTVGLDVEKVDSKHANSMRKHFAGLVDEMAIKQEFLMGFSRGSEKIIKELGTKEVFSLEKATRGNNDSKIALESSSSPQEPDLSIIAEKEKEETIQELRDCLPVWVTREQILDLISNWGTNIVEAVSSFYERETEFYEQINARNTSTSKESKEDQHHEVPQHKDSKSPYTRNLIESPNKRSSTNITVSPGKQKSNVDNKPNKKKRTTSKIESSGSKQSTITSFFGKAATTASQNNEVGRLSEKCPKGENLLQYKEEVDQFIQIIDGSDLSRSYAATILEKAKGDINMALDLYYSNLKADLSNCVREEKTVSKEPVRIIELPTMEDSTENVGGTFVSLPLEKYSPIEHACWRTGQPAPYIHLARTFELVEAEKGKIKATSMLCNMFRSLLSLSPCDVLAAVYLCTNKIAADHENMELNIGGSLVTAALEEACGTNKSKIREMYNSLGDLGDVAQLCRQTQSLLAPPSPLLIQDVFSALRKICVQTGSGSTVRKKRLIVNLMRSCREKETKFLVRTLVRNLRIGAMMRTVLPALAQAVVLNALSNSQDELTAGNLKEKLQGLSAAVVEAYNVLPNLDLLVPSLLDKGIEFSSTTLSMIPGIPIRPMLAKITNGVLQAVKQFQNKSFTCEFKYDGQRAQIHKLADGSVRIFSRNGDETTSRFPDLVNIIEEICRHEAFTFILDAEVVAVDRKNGCKLLSFQELSSRERGGKSSTITVDSIKVDVCIFAFDIMFANGEQLLGYPLRQRRKYLQDLFCDEKLGYFEYAKELTVEADDACLSSEATLTKINSFLEDAFHSSCEGIMIKSLDVDAEYFPSKRTDTWLKVKRDYVEGLNDSLDLVPIGAWHGNGRKAGWYSPFLTACYNPDTEDFQSVCRVMSGFSDSFYIEMKEFFSGDKILTKKPPYYQTAEVPDMWFSPELVWEIRGADFTVSPVHKAAIGLVHPSRGISVRFPRFVRSVLDRNPEECSTATDIAEMFHSQTRKMDINLED